MYNIFIGWSGNKPLADKLGDLIAQSGRMRRIVQLDGQDQVQYQKLQ